MAVDIVMPQMGESIFEGTITKWLKKPGDKVERDEPLFEISTDKVDAEIPSPAPGTLTEIKFKEGDTVEVNTVVAVLDGAGPQPAAETTTAKEQEAPPPASQPTEAPPAEATPAEAEPVVEQPGEPAPPVPPAQTPAPQTPAASSHKTEVKPLHRKADAPAASPDNGSSTAEDLRRTKSSPLVRKIAEEHGIDIKQLEGTGMSGRVTKNDILSFIESGSPAQAPAPVPTAAATPQPTASASAPPVGAPGMQQVPAIKPGEGDRVEQM